jgi:hypothetical protein
MTPTSRRAGTLWWWEPRWSFVPRIKRETAEILAPRKWLRILALSTAVILVLAFILRRALPDLEFNWLAASLWAVRPRSFRFCS